jgi:hypothetical protein
MIRTLLAAGISSKEIASKLHIQSYQVNGALNKRSTVDDDNAWTVELLQKSEYSVMKWSPEEFVKIIDQVPVMSRHGVCFDYKNLKHFEHILVE